MEIMQKEKKGRMHFKTYMRNAEEQMNIVIFVNTLKKKQNRFFLLFNLVQEIHCKMNKKRLFKIWKQVPIYIDS